MYVDDVYLVCLSFKFFLSIWSYTSLLDSRKPVEFWNFFILKDILFSNIILLFPRKSWSQTESRNVADGFSSLFRSVLYKLLIPLRIQNSFVPLPVYMARKSKFFQFSLHPQNQLSFNVASKLMYEIIHQNLFNFDVYDKLWINAGKSVPRWLRVNCRWF